MQQPIWTCIIGSVSQNSICRSLHQASGRLGRRTWLLRKITENKMPVFMLRIRDKRPRKGLNDVADCRLGWFKCWSVSFFPPAPQLVSNDASACLLLVAPPCTFMPRGEPQRFLLELYSVVGLCATVARRIRLTKSGSGAGLLVFLILLLAAGQNPTTARCVVALEWASTWRLRRLTILFMANPMILLCRPAFPISWVCV